MSDLQERIAKAMHDSNDYDPALYGTWEEEVAAADVFQNTDRDYIDPYVNRSRRDADAAIRAFAEAMLSAEAVEAAGRSLYDYGNDWESERPVTRRMFEGRAMDAIDAALKAIGATEGEGDD